MRRLIEKIIQRKNPHFQLDPALRSRVIISLAWQKAWALLRGIVRQLLLLRRPGLLFMGRGIRFFNSPNMQFGRYVQLEDQVSLSALGRGKLKLGNNVRIGAQSRLIVSTSFNHIGEHIHIGDNVGIGEFAYLGGGGGLDIGADCIIGQYFSCHPENHNYTDTNELIRLQGTTRQGIRIGANCWIGSKVTILDGVTIGKHCVLAAGAVVTKDIPDYSVVGGVPAKVLRQVSLSAKAATTPIKAISMKENKNAVLVSAYAVNPNKGSEDGTGWNIIRSIAAQQPVIAITRENNAPAIENRLQSEEKDIQQNLQFLYYDLPKWSRFWKKGGRGALLYHYLWHLGLVFFVRKQKIQFDIAHHLNFHSDWSPSFLWMLGKPFVWGPVGHHPRIPARYFDFYGKKEKYKDQLRWLTKKFFWTFDPFLKITKYKAKQIIGINSSVQQVLGLPDHKISVLPAVASEDFGWTPTQKERFTVLSVGRFVPLKGFDITIRSFARFYTQQPAAVQQNLHLHLIGKGPYKKALQQLAAELLPQSAYSFISWMPREELLNHFIQASAFLFPSHEGAGMVVPEALSFGLPVLCFDNHGPGEFINPQCGFRVSYEKTYEEAVEAFADGLQQLQAQEQHSNMCLAARQQYERLFKWSYKGAFLQQVYENIRQPSVDKNYIPCPQS